jgi:F-type H+-transporting ATPase subunit gamma
MRCWRSSSPASTDRVEIIFTKFINLVSSQPVVQTLLPLDPQGIATSRR